MDVVIITPEKGRQKDIGQQLLALSDHPRQVQWVTWPQAGFQVPLELFAKFHADTDESPAEAAAVQEVDAAVETPKRRGRPRKQEQDSTDNNTSEEE